MDFSKLDKLIDTMPSRGIPACDLAITQYGEPVYRRMAGYADLAGTRPVSDRDLYWIHSATKVITCVAAVRLIEEGKLSLEDPVSRYLPEFAHLTVRTPEGPVPCRTPMTILHLFTMTGGMDYDVTAAPIAEAAARPGAGTVDIVRAMAAVPLHFEPGTIFKYSLCHDVLGAVVEIVSGMRFSDYLRRTIFDPLEMGDTGFSPTEEQRARFSQAYRYRAADGKAFPCEGHGFDFPGTAYESGGGGLFSCPGDYVRLMSALALGGTAKNGYRVLRPESVASLEVNRLSVDALAGLVGARLYGYGWGLCGRVHVNPAYSLSRASVGEFGWDGAAAAFAMVDRPHGIGLFFGTHVHSCTYAYHVLHPLIRDLAEEALGF